MHKIAAATAHLEGLAKTIAVPNLNRPHRLPTFPNLERTAVLSFTDTLTQATPSGGSLYGCLTRDPAYPLWLSFDFSQTPSSMYRQGIFTNPSAPDGISMPLGEMVDVDLSINDEVYRNGLFGTFGSFIGAIPYFKRGGDAFIPFGGRCGSVTDPKFTFALELLTDNVNNSISGYLQIQCLTGNLEVVDKRLTLGTFSPGSTSGGSPAPVYSHWYHYVDIGDYIGVRVVDLKLVGTASSKLKTVAYGVTTSYSTLPAYDRQFPLTVPMKPAGALVRLMPTGVPPEWNTSPLIWQSTRATATAVLLTNVTSVMEKEGTISAARLPVGNATSGTSAFHPGDWTGFAAVHPKDRYFGAMEKGLYTYSLPDANSEVFHDCMLAADSSASTDTQFPVANLDAFAFVNCFVFSDADATRRSALAITVDRHIEFRTTSRLFPTDFSKEGLETYHGAQMALNRMGVFMENPVHLATIAEMASQAVRALWPIVRPYAIPAAQAVATTAVNWAKGKIAGSMTQSSLAKPPEAQQSRKQRQRKVRVQRRKKA